MAEQSTEFLEDVADAPIGCWLFVANIGNAGEAYFQDSAVGDIVGWRHGNDQYMRMMQRGDEAVIYITDGSSAEIRGLGIVVSAREPFILDTTRYDDSKAYVQRIPILITHLFEEKPIKVEDVESQTKTALVKGSGSVHEISLANKAEIRAQSDALGIERNVFTMSPEDKARAVGGSTLGNYLNRADLAFYQDYISRRQREKMRETDDPPSGDLSNTQALEKIDQIWRDLGAPIDDIGGARGRNDLANLQPVNDNPAGLEVDDKLQRYPMARILASRLRSVFEEARSSWERFEKSPSSNRRPHSYPGETVDAAPFTLLVDSPWGGGKSSFANFLTNILSERNETGSGSPAIKADNPWTIVSFNAWRHQHVKPVWWVLNGYIFDALLDQHEAKRTKLSRWTMWLSHKAWQLATWQNIVAFSAWILACFMAVLLYKSGFISGDKLSLPRTEFGSGDPSDATVLSSGAIGAVTLLALAGLPIVATFRGLITSLGHSLNPGRASAENNHALGSSDPLERFRRHFRRTLAKEGTPILLVIDDLDRCQSSFVVDLVQGLQTLLRSQYLFVLLLGDRAWIEKCFDVEFKDMDDDDPNGRQSELGRKYVEKALQMSLTLPQPTIEQRSALLKSVTAAEIEVARGGEDTDEAAVNDTELDAGTVDDQSKADRAEAARERKQRKEDDRRWALAQAHVDSVQNKVTIRQTVLKFVGYFPNNPRQIKRIVNTISFYQGIAIGLNKFRLNDADWEKFFVWIIAYLEFVDQWAALSRDPAQITKIRQDAGLSGQDLRFRQLLNFEISPHSWQNGSSIT
ncbi:MAG: P-loop NTPase fold protein, partial [Pseudomonadota bacterium]